MDTATILKCLDCGSQLEGKVSKSGLVTCAYCGSGYDLRSQTGTEQPLIAKADFSGAEISGWRHGSKFIGTTNAGVWSVIQSNDGLNHPLLVAPGAYDDFEVTLTFRFSDCHPEDFVFLRGRGGPAGAMIVQCWPNGSLGLRWQKPDHNWQKTIVETQSAKPRNPQDWRQLRRVAKGQRHLAYLDGALALSANHPTILNSGYLDVRIQTENPSVSIEVSQLELYQVK